MRSKTFNNILIVFGSICIFVAILLAPSHYQVSNSKGEIEETNEMKKSVVTDLATLKTLYQNIVVGDSTSGEGGDSFSFLTKSIGSPDEKTESYSSSNQPISYSWHKSFKWENPLTFLVINVIDGKVVSKSLGVENTTNGFEKNFNETFDTLKNGDLYSVNQLIQKLGYPTEQSTFRLANGQTSTTLNWGTVDSSHTIFLTDQEIVYKSASSH
jgi:hypothetical protein